MYYGVEKLDLTRLICLIEGGNTASMKVAKNIGMTFEKEGRDEIGPFLLYSRNFQTRLKPSPQPVRSPESQPLSNHMYPEESP